MDYSKHVLQLYAIHFYRNLLEDLWYVIVYDMWIFKWAKDVRTRIRSRDIFTEAVNVLSFERFRSNLEVFIHTANLIYYKMWFDMIFADWRSPVATSRIHFFDLAIDFRRLSRRYLAKIVFFLNFLMKIAPFFRFFKENCMFISNPLTKNGFLLRDHLTIIAFFRNSLTKVAMFFVILW